MVYSKRAYSSSGISKRRTEAVVQTRKPKPKISNLKLNPTVAKLVDRRINKSEQTHYKTLTSTVINFDSSIDEGDFRQLLPPISAGDQMDQRTGKSIKLVSLVIKGYLKYVPSGDNDDDSYAVRLMVVSSKKYKSFAQCIGATNPALANRQDMAANLVRDGKDARDFNGSFLALNLPVNAAEITTHYDKIQYMTSDAVLAELRTGDADVTTRTSVRTIIRPFTISLKVKNKIIKYEEESDIYPSSFFPMITQGFLNLNTGNPDTNTRVALYYQVHMRWKDM